MSTPDNVNKYLKVKESIVIGRNHAEIEAAVDIIMGRKTDAWLSPIHVSQWPADIVTLDQQLGHDHLQGTDIAAALAEENFQGVVCILSGENPSDKMHTTPWKFSSAKAAAMSVP